jgi:hypothetical protein
MKLSCFGLGEECMDDERKWKLWLGAMIVVCVAVLSGYIADKGPSYVYGDYSSAIALRLNRVEDGSPKLADEMLSLGITSIAHVRDTYTATATFVGGGSEEYKFSGAAPDRAFEVAAYKGEKTGANLVIVRVKADRAKESAESVAAEVTALSHDVLTYFSKSRANRASWSADNSAALQR